MKKGIPEIQDIYDYARYLLEYLLADSALSTFHDDEDFHFPYDYIHLEYGQFSAKFCYQSKPHTGCRGLKAVRDDRFLVRDPLGGSNLFHPGVAEYARFDFIIYKKTWRKKDPIRFYFDMMDLHVGVKSAFDYSLYGKYPIRKKERIEIHQWLKAIAEHLNDTWILKSSKRESHPFVNFLTDENTTYVLE